MGHRSQKLSKVKSQCFIHVFPFIEEFSDKVGKLQLVSYYRSSPLKPKLLLCSEITEARWKAVFDILFENVRHGAKE